MGYDVYVKVSRSIFMAYYPCPHLNGFVELTSEREQHIALRHPDLLPKYANHIGKVLSDPDQIRRSDRFADAHLFTRWFNDVNNGKYIVVVVVADQLMTDRHWIITAYISRRLSGGKITWERN